MFENLKELALHCAKGTAPANFTNETVQEAFQGELAKYCSSLAQFMKNRWDLYEIIIETVDTIVPAKVIDALAPFAEVKSVPQGQAAMFQRKIGKARARKFLTQVGLSGVYETFRLDKERYSVTPISVGGAVSIDFERLLDGADILSDLMEVITEGMVDSVYGQIQRALRSVADVAGPGPAQNRVINAGFDGSKMLKLINIAKAYGGGQAVIFAPPEFVGEMGPDAIVPVSVGTGQGVYHPQDIDAIHNTGYINTFRGNPIVQIPQSFTDESNTKTWIDPSIAYIFPAGKEKVVKVVFEGNTQMYDWTNKDQSMEINTYRKLGVAIEAYHYWCVYKNTDISVANGFADFEEDIYDVL